MEEGKFKIRSYGWQELALLYGEGLTPRIVYQKIKQMGTGQSFVDRRTGTVRMEEREKDSDTHTGAGYRPFSGRTVSEKTDSYAWRIT